MNKNGQIEMPVIIPLVGGGVRTESLTVPCSYLANGEEVLDGWAMQLLDLFKAAHMMSDAAKTLAALTQGCPPDASVKRCPNAVAVHRAAAVLNEVLLKVEPLLREIGG